MAVDERQELEELRRIDELERKAQAAPARVLDISKLTDPHEIEFAKGRQGQLSDDEIQEGIRQYRAITKADKGKATQGWTNIPTMKGAAPQVIPAAQVQQETPAPTIPATSSKPGFFTPRLTMEDLKGASGQSALASGLAMSAFAPGLAKIPAFVAGAGGSLLADEGTRRLQENMGETPGALAGMGLSLLTGMGVGMAGRTPSHPTQFKGAAIESPETTPQPFTIPASEALHETIPRGGAYATGPEMLTPPGARIDPRHQFSTGTGESLFGPLERLDAPEMGPFGGEPIAMPQGPKTRIWQDEGVPSDNSFTSRLDEKYPTLESKPVAPRVITPDTTGYIRSTVDLQSLRKANAFQFRSPESGTSKPSTSQGPLILDKEGQVIDGNHRLREAVVRGDKTIEVLAPPTPIKAPVGLDMGATGPSGEYIPPKTYIEPPTPNRFRQAWNAEKQRWGQELPVLKTQPTSPVISSVEATHVYVEDFMEGYVHQPWLKGLMKFGDNTKLAPLEKHWIAEHKAGRDPQANMPDDFKQMFTRMDTLLAEENAINRRRGLPEIPKVDGPYAPRMTDDDFKLMRSITRNQEGAKTPQSIGSFGDARTIETLDEGLRKGVTYKDWRQVLLLREARGAALRATDIMLTDLEKMGVLHRTKEAAEAASLTGKAFAAEGIPFQPKGGWWVRSGEERQFLLQNLRQMGTGTLADIRGWAQQWLRNPSLVNPWPHIVKNMGLKQMQQAVASGLRPDQVFKQTLIHRWGKPDMLEEFQKVMPFTKSGSTVWELIEKAGPKTTIQQMSRVPGILNSYARGKIFADWDPAMRYGLWREYVKKGMNPQEAANHTWIDLIRYGTRADRIDAWNSVPFNFFVPWRVGTMRTMNKALQSAPVRFGLFMGAVDTIREMDYRMNGRWTHLPYDYVERPLMTLVKEGKSEALQTALATMTAGPGGEYMFRSIQNILNEAQGKGTVGDVRTLVWGLAQVYDLWPQYKAWQKDGKAEHITDMLGLVLLGRHATPYGGPHRFGELIPESFIRTNPAVHQGEEMREGMKQHSDVKAMQKQQRDIEKYQQPWPIVPTQ